MFFSDFGISLQIIGVFLLMFTVDRLPRGYVCEAVDDGTEPKEHSFYKIRQKLIPDGCVTRAFIFGLFAVVFGLVLQLSYFNSFTLEITL